MSGHITIGTIGEIEEDVDGTITVQMNDAKVVDSLPMVLDMAGHHQLARQAEQ
ncbi:hypothetical protein [Bifidobacterium crudilactis]|jgi:hypothetical protein|uniref:hypothetical protein n=1 Tax=Bifidobacterium crudilactis TaxID=327277 RepID=UPI0023536D5C|nr:hypothetical protein [Bifidobacterium crudilactis]MCI1868241.1 hypothetical protein [Bifidobacterium crudilactis]